MKGVCVVIANPQGVVVASAVDFGGVDAAGFSIEREQERRAGARARMSFARQHLNHWLAGALDSDDAYRFWSLAERAGYRVSIIPVDGGDA